MLTTAIFAEMRSEGEKIRHELTLHFTQKINISHKSIMGEKSEIVSRIFTRINRFSQQRSNSNILKRIFEY